MPESLPLRRPLRFVRPLVCLVLGTNMIAYAITAIWRGPVFARNIIGEGLLGSAATVLLSRFGWWRVAGFRIPRQTMALGYLALGVLSYYSMPIPTSPCGAFSLVARMSCHSSSWR